VSDQTYTEKQFMQLVGELVGFKVAMREKYNERETPSTLDDWSRELAAYAKLVHRRQKDPPPDIRKYRGAFKVPDSGHWK
jgi:hypothetical protein